MFSELAMLQKTQKPKFQGSRFKDQSSRHSVQKSGLKVQGSRHKTQRSKRKTEGPMLETHQVQVQWCTTDGSIPRTESVDFKAQSSGLEFQSPELKTKGLRRKPQRPSFRTHSMAVAVI